jgi:hypothetical protein
MGTDGFDEADRFKAYSKEGDSAYYVSGLAVSFLASLFGAIHCISWSFTFPSPAFQTTWRICSVFITCSPMVLAVFPVISWYFKCELAEWPVSDWIQIPVGIIGIVLLPPLYVVSRIILLVIAFRSLSAIPATGHQTIEWADFIPHI